MLISFRTREHLYTGGVKRREVCRAPQSRPTSPAVTAGGSIGTPEAADVAVIVGSDTSES